MENFFLGWQQDLKLAVLPPLLCCIFRMIFIIKCGGRSLSAWPGRLLYKCFSYGFWWGMDINSRMYLLTLLLVTLPGSLSLNLYLYGDKARLFLYDIFFLILYIAFMGKMIFYYHFRDIFNRNMWLGKNADKKNLVDIFFNQNHGLAILLGIIPYIAILHNISKLLLTQPIILWPGGLDYGLQVALFTVVFLLSIAIYYWFNFGGTFRHRLKPEWDEVPAEVKNDVFLAKATVDDLVALKIVWKHPVPAFMTKDEDKIVEEIKGIIPDFAVKKEENPLKYLKRIVKGAKIPKPRHIFYILAESHCQLLYDEPYNSLNIAKYTKRLRDEEETFTVNNFQPAGMISQTALGSILLGIYDCDMEMNENKSIWECNLAQIPTNLAGQMKKLGYKTHFWYGGSLNWGSLVHFAPQVGFDSVLGGPDFCPKDAPKTWLGIYDHIYLENVADKIQAEDQGEMEFHFIYTTSNHGPYNIPYEKYGITEEEAVSLPLGDLRSGDMDMRRFAGVLYADKSIFDFVERMKALYPDSMFIITGDHASALVPYDKNIIPRREQLIRERMLTAFSIHHRDLEGSFFADNSLGEHFNILPTIMELIAEKGTEYYSLKPSLTEKIEHVATPYGYLTEDSIGYYLENRSQQLRSSAQEVASTNKAELFLAERDGLMSITAWLLKHPELLK